MLPVTDCPAVIIPPAMLIILPFVPRSEGERCTTYVVRALSAEADVNVIVSVVNGPPDDDVYVGLIP